MSGDVLQIYMLDVLRAPFEEWLATRGFVLAHPPGEDERVLVVCWNGDVPDEVERR